MCPLDNYSLENYRLKRALLDKKNKQTNKQIKKNETSLTFEDHNKEIRMT